MTTIAENIINRRFVGSPDVATVPTTSGKTFEHLALGLGATTLQRELFPDGSHGPIIVESNDPLPGIRANTHTITHELNVDGKLDLVAGGNNVYPDKSSKLRRAIILSRVAFGRVDRSKVNDWSNDGYDAGIDSQSS